MQARRLVPPPPRPLGIRRRAQTFRVGGGGRAASPEWVAVAKEEREFVQIHDGGQVGDEVTVKVLHPRKHCQIEIDEHILTHLLFVTWCVTGDHLFVISATCPLLSCSDVSDCHSPFSVMCIALCSDHCLAQGQPVGLHS